METVNLTQIQSQPKSRLREFLETFPLIHIAFVILFSVITTYTTVQVTQGFQTEKIKKLEDSTVSRELFDERTTTILYRLEKQGEKLDKILENK